MITITLLLGMELRLGLTLSRAVSDYLDFFNAHCFQAVMTCTNICIDSYLVSLQYNKGESFS